MIDDGSNITQSDHGGPDHILTLEDFRNQTEKLREMFDVPPVEVPLPTMMDQMFLEMRDIMRLQAESITVQGSNRALMHTLTYQL